MFFMMSCGTVTQKKATSSNASKKDSVAILEPNIQRIKIATVVTEDVSYSKKLYSEWLDYKIVEEGSISVALANSWGTPKTVGKSYALLQPESGDDVYLRLIEGSPAEDYKAMTTYGWNAIEIIVEDPELVYEKLRKSAFEHIGGPAFLVDGLSTIQAVQYKGPSEEVFYFTTDKGDRTKSSLLTPRSAIDRPFIMVLAGGDSKKLTDFYVNTFGAAKAFSIQTPIDLIAKAQGLALDYDFELSLIRLGAFSNAIEIDGYPTSASFRSRPLGELAPGVSITTFTVRDLDLIDAKLFIASPMSPKGEAYKGNRTATIKGLAGELIELIEEKNSN